jgi:hypothetical protein
MLERHRRPENLRDTSGDQRYFVFFVQLNESRIPLSTCKDEIYGFDALDWLIWLLVESQMETSAFPGDVRGVHLPGLAS